MDASIQPQQALQAILDVIERCNGDADGFAETLRREKIPHISYSQISTVESCRHRYHLQYILGQELQPVPDYFTKGKLFHQLLASHYRENNCSSSQESLALALSEIAGEYEGRNQRHLENAYRVHLQHSWKDCEVIAVEKPFAMLIDPHLPPCVGVIDLAARQDDTTIIVDHKTGRDFYPQDELQSAIYMEYMRREFGGDVRSAFYYDHYRWVENLHLIRKPALQRTRIDLPPGAWLAALERIRQGYQKIVDIWRDGRGLRYGECFRCPYRLACWDD